MNLSNAVYLFAEKVIDAASSGDVLADAALHQNLYEKLEARKTIRIGRVEQSEPRLVGNFEVGRFNAYLTVQILVECQNSSISHKIDAADEAEATAAKLAAHLLESEGLNGTCDSVAIPLMQDDYQSAGGKLYAVTGLLLLINGR